MSLCVRSQIWIPGNTPNPTAPWNGPAGAAGTGTGTGTGILSQLILSCGCTGYTQPELFLAPLEAKSRNKKYFSFTLFALFPLLTKQTASFSERIPTALSVRCDLLSFTPYEITELLNSEEQLFLITLFSPPLTVFLTHLDSFLTVSFHVTSWKKYAF